MLGDVLDEVAVCVYVKDPCGRFLYINRAGAEAIGLTPEAMIGRLQQEVVDPEAGAAWQAQDLDVLSSRAPWDGEEVHGEITFMTHKVPLFDADGRAAAVIGISTDITTRKRHEERLRRSADRLVEAQQIAGVGSWHWDAETGETTMSPELCRICGIDPPGAPIADNAAAIALVHPDDRDRITAAAQAAMSDGSPLDLDLRIVRQRDGAERLIHVHAAVTLGPDGIPLRLDGTGTDVTERRTAERRLAEAQRLAELGSWEWHLETDEIRWSEEMYRIAGVDPEHFVPTREVLESWSVPEDRERLDDDIRAAVSANGSFDTFLRISRPDGEVREIRLRGTVVAGGSEPTYMLGICQDLTDLRRTRADLAEATELFRSCFDDAPVGMALVAPGGHFQQVNDALCAFLGRSAEALEGMTVMEVTDERDLPATMEALHAIVTGEAQERTIEKRYVRPDGTRVWGALRASVIRDADGDPQHGLAVIQDVTERRRTELRRATLHEAATVMAENGPLSTALPALVGTLSRALGLSGGEVRLTEKGAAAPEPTPGRLGFRLLSGPEMVGVMEFDGESSDLAGEELALLTHDLGAQIGDFVVRKRAQEQLMHLALHDPLTGLPNRVLFFDRLDQALRRTQREPAPLGVLFLDFDGFKAVNDRFGHAEGDEVLRCAAERVSAALRVNDTVARFGGDELVILSEHIAGPDAAQVIAERVLDALKAPIAVRDQRVELTASIGICVAMEPGATRDGMLRSADTAMYEAKAAGPGRFVIAG